MSSMNVMNVMNVLQHHQGGKLNLHPYIPLGNVHDVHNVHETVFGVFWGIGARFRANFYRRSVRGVDHVTK